MQSSAALLKSRIESALGAPYLTWREERQTEFVPTGIAELDAIAGGLPRGSITDLYGSTSSGRTSLMLTALAEATARQEVCAVIDSSDSFDPASAAACGADLERILWVRCAGRPDHALKAADMLVQAGGFGFIALDFAGIAPAVTRKIPLASWHRFRKAVENTPAVLLVIEDEPTVKSCASLVIEMRPAEAAWSGAQGCSDLLRGLNAEAVPRKPVRSQTAAFEASAFPEKLRAVSGQVSAFSFQPTASSHKQAGTRDERSAARTQPLPFQKPIGGVTAEGVASGHDTGDADRVDGRKLIADRRKLTADR